MTLLVNDREVDVGPNRLFKARVPVTADGTQVSVVAIDQSGRRGELRFVLKHRSIASQTPAETAARDGPPGQAVEDEFGNYVALVIGNDTYQHMPRLETAVADAGAVAKIFAGKYGFKVTTLVNATRYEILSALNRLRETLTVRDNLVIYYAGHGILDRINQRGHWLPVDADPNSTANWISNVAITDILNTMSPRHVLVVADSCYSGSLTRTALARLRTGMTDTGRATWIKTMKLTRSRTALTSGGLKPVLDQGRGGHSVFAKAFLAALQSYDVVVEAQRLFLDISPAVVELSLALGHGQVPEYAPIKFAGHEGGEMFFVPRRGGG